MRSLALVLLSVGVVGLGPGPAAVRAQARAQAGKGRQFTQGERARLAKGQIVVRSMQRRVGDRTLIGGTSWQLVNAPAERVWSILRRPSDYEHILPKLVATRRVAQEGNDRVQYFQHGAGPVSASYYLRMHSDQDKRELSFHMDKRHRNSIDDLYGFYSVHALDASRSVIAYGVMVDLGKGLVVSLLRDTIHKWMLLVPEDLKKLAERRERRAQR